MSKTQQQFEQAFRSLITEELKGSLDQWPIRDEIESALQSQQFFDVSVRDDLAIPGHADYSCGVRFSTQDGKRIGTLSADRAHNHLGFYTRHSGFGDDVTDPTPWVKRLNIQGGQKETQIRLYSPTSSRMMVSSSGTSGESTVQWITRSGNKMHMGANEKGQGYLSNISKTDARGGIFTFDLHGDNGIGINENPIRGLREIEHPTPDDLSPQEWAWDATERRWLYRDSEGTVHWFAPCGTL